MKKKREKEKGVDSRQQTKDGREEEEKELLVNAKSHFGGRNAASVPEE